MTFENVREQTSNWRSHSDADNPHRPDATGRAATRAEAPLSADGCRLTWVYATPSRYPVGVSPARLAPLHTKGQT